MAKQLALPVHLRYLVPKKDRGGYEEELPTTTLLDGIEYVVLNTPNNGAIPVRIFLANAGCPLCQLSNKQGTLVKTTDEKVLAYTCNRCHITYPFVIIGGRQYILTAGPKEQK